MSELKVASDKAKTEMDVAYSQVKNAPRASSLQEVQSRQELFSLTSQNINQAYENTRKFSERRKEHDDWRVDVEVDGAQKRATLASFHALACKIKFERLFLKVVALGLEQNNVVEKIANLEFKMNPQLIQSTATKDKNSITIITKTVSDLAQTANLMEQIVANQKKSNELRLEIQKSQPEMSAFKNARVDPELLNKATVIKAEVSNAVGELLNDSRELGEWISKRTAPITLPENLVNRSAYVADRANIMSQLTEERQTLLTTANALQSALKNFNSLEQIQ
ncbi:MAG: hypothetical protein JST89_14025 [Cyanobacteria bacterium SZAS-4]|nr:hypothetical protein [Cyanobacteria bacterium SZAS-4]